MQCVATCKMEPVPLRRIPPSTCCTSDQPLWFKAHWQTVTFNKSRKFFSHGRSTSSHERPTSSKWSNEALPVKHKEVMGSYVWKWSLDWFIDLFEQILCIHLGNLQQTTFNLLINLEIRGGVPWKHRKSHWTTQRKKQNKPRFLELGKITWSEHFHIKW